MAICIFILLRTICTMVFFISFSQASFNKRFCDKNEFQIPYMKLYADEVGGSLIYEINKGFRNVYNLNNVYICIHGPALIYLDAKRVDDDRHFHDVHFQTFVHECFFINTIRTSQSTEAVPSNPLLAQVINDQTGENDNNDCRANTTTSADNSLSAIPNLPDHHKRIWGIFLLGKEENFVANKLQVFYSPRYEVDTLFTYTNDFKETPPFSKTRNGISFIGIGTISSCIVIGGQNFTVLSKPTTNSQICFRQQRNETVDNLLISSLANSQSITITVLDGVAETLETTQHKEHSDHVEFTSCNSSSENIIELNECVDLPFVEDECEKTKPDTEFACKLVKIIIGGETPEIPENLKWLKEILTLIESIFEKACPMIPQEFISAVSTMIDYYVQGITSSAGDRNTFSNTSKRDFWKFLIGDLTTCRDKVEPMEFTPIGFVSVSQYKKELTFMNRTSKGKEKVNLFYYTELADHQFNFNYIVDMSWIMFATVLGICPTYYNSKVASTSSRLYTMFSDDFLIPMTSTWLDPSHNPTLEIVLGRFINHHVHLKALSCLEASYVQSHTTAYRFQRPLIVSTSPCETSANAFI